MNGQGTGTDAMGRLKGKIALVTGGARGIGLAIARALTAQGAVPVLADINEEGARQALAGLGASEGMAAAVDVADQGSVTALIDAIVARYGRLDILVNNAGVTQPVKTLDIDEASWDRIQDINCKGVLFLSQVFIPHMQARRRGSIVCMSSVSAQRGGGIFGGPHYSSAKAGVLGLAKAMAREFGPDGIRVNCVTPGLIETDITGGKLTPEMRADIIRGIPLGRLGQAADVAGIYLFLASDLSAYVTGAVIDVNGGMLIHG